MHRTSRKAVSEINITPFVDIMLVLLIIFMVTAPLLVSGIEVNLPDASAKVVTSEEEPLQISIDKDVVIYIQDKPIRREDLGYHLEELKGREGGLGRLVHVRADKNLEYGEVIGIVGELHRNGFRKISLLARQKDKLLE